MPDPPPDGEDAVTTLKAIGRDVADALKTAWATFVRDPAVALRDSGRHRPMNAREVFRKLKHFALWLLRQSFWFRTAAKFVSALAGSIVIGRWNAIATYVYAKSEGFRMPVEGTPYVAFTASLLGFVVLVGLLLVGAFTRSLITEANRFLNARQSVDDSVDRLGLKLGGVPRRLIRLILLYLRAVPFIGLVIIVGLFISALTSASASIFAAYLPNVQHILAMSEYVGPAIKGLVVTVGAGLVAIVLLDPIKTTLAGIMLGMASLVVLMAMMVCPHYYAAFLQHIRFGGGTVAVLITEGRTQYAGEVLLTTNTTYFMRGVEVNRPNEDCKTCTGHPFAKATEIMEIPAKAVSEVRYPNDIKDFVTGLEWIRLNGSHPADTAVVPQGLPEMMLFEKVSGLGDESAELADDEDPEENGGAAGDDAVGESPTSSPNSEPVPISPEIGISRTSPAGQQSDSE